MGSQKIGRLTVDGMDVDRLIMHVQTCLFANIKPLFFQPCDKELLVIVHIHLKASIMIRK